MNNLEVQKYQLTEVEWKKYDKTNYLKFISSLFIFYTIILRISCRENTSPLLDQKRNIHYESPAFLDLGPLCISLSTWLLTYRVTGANESLFRQSLNRIITLMGIVIVLVDDVSCYTLSIPSLKYEDDLPDPTSPLPPSPSPLGKYSVAAVAANAEPCAQVGRNILQKGGSAVDAAIATMLCDGVTNPQSAGIGGGFLMTIYNRKNRSAETLHARETAPAAACKDMFGGNSTLATIGGLSIAIPGAIKGYWMAHKKYGFLPWRDLFTPTINLCQKGVPVSEYLAKHLKNKEDLIKNSPTMSEIFIDPTTGKAWVKGNFIKHPDLAKGLMVIAEQGADALYNGVLTKCFVDDIRSNGGIITREDMINYKAKWLKPITAKLVQGNVTLYSMPPPGSGVLVAFGLNILDGSLPAKNKIVSLQRIVETFKYMYGKRTELGDPDYVDIIDLMKNLTSRDYAKQIQQLISDNVTWQDPKHYGAIFDQPKDYGTSHISVIAPNGDAVSVTSTINLLFGSMIRSRSTGIILNNEMDDFSSPNITNNYGFPPSPANFIAPGKSPISSMSPSIFVDNNSGDVRLIIGASGGSKITSSTTLASVYNLWFKKTIKEAIDASRIHHQLLPMTLSYEYGVLKEEVEGLKKIGHKMKRIKVADSTITGIARNGNELQANADYRRFGVIDGF